MVTMSQATAGAIMHLGLLQKAVSALPLSLAKSAGRTVEVTQN